MCGTNELHRNRPKIERENTLKLLESEIEEGTLQTDPTERKRIIPTMNSLNAWVQPTGQTGVRSLMTPLTPSMHLCIYASMKVRPNDYKSFIFTFK